MLLIQRLQSKQPVHWWAVLTRSASFLLALPAILLACRRFWWLAGNPAGLLAILLAGWQELVMPAEGCVSALQGSAAHLQHDGGVCVCVRLTVRGADVTFPNVTSDWLGRF